jgi:hypothetical protein
MSVLLPFYFIAQWVHYRQGLALLICTHHPLHTFPGWGISKCHMYWRLFTVYCQMDTRISSPLPSLVRLPVHPAGVL